MLALICEKLSCNGKQKYLSTRSLQECQPYESLMVTTTITGTAGITASP
jgi:hypothetical protein